MVGLYATKWTFQQEMQDFALLLCHLLLVAIPIQSQSVASSWSCIAVSIYLLLFFLVREICCSGL